MEEEIGKIVASMLEREVGPDDDLFSQGATSLTFVRIITEINQRWNLSLNGSEVDGVATVRRLAEVVDAAVAPASTNV